MDRRPLLTGDHDPRSRVPTVQVAHEALLRSWPRLASLDRGRPYAIIQLHRLRDATAEWQRVGRDNGALYRGARLDAALELAPARRDSLPVGEREFLAASVELREPKNASGRNRSSGRPGPTVVCGSSWPRSVGAGRCPRGRRHRDRPTWCGTVRARRRRPRRSGRDGRELAAAADATVEADPERAMLLALAAIETTRSVDGTMLPSAVDALHRAVTESRVLRTVEGVGGRLDWSPVDDTFVTEGPEESGMIDIRDATTGESVLSFRGDEIDVNAVEYSPRRLEAGRRRRRRRVEDLRSDHG